MNLRIFIALPAIFVLVSGTAFSQSKAKPVWKTVGTAEDNDQKWKNFYDTKSIKREPKGMVQVWTKQVPVIRNADDKQKWIQGLAANRKLNGMPTEGYDAYAYTLTLVELNCQKKEARDITTKDYNSADHLLGQQTILKNKYSFAAVGEGSVSRIMLDAVCKK